jgi:hypothetical protein
MSISAVLADVLAARRERYNAAVARARLQQPAFDPQTFTDVLRGELDALVQAVANVAPHRVVAVTDALFASALDLTSERLIGAGARATAPGLVWRSLAPHYASVLAQHPTAVISALTNAALQIENSGRLAEWVDVMTRVAGLIVTVPHLTAAGALIAWRSGMTHLRNAVLALDDESLPAPLALACLDAPAHDNWSALRQQLRDDPWRRADGKPTPPTIVGQFTGLGGAFSLPPQVRACEEGFVVRSGERYFCLMADAYGSILHAATDQDFATAASHVERPHPRIRDGQIVDGDQPMALVAPVPEPWFVSDEHSIVVGSAHSYRLQLYPRP